MVRPMASEDYAEQDRAADELAKQRRAIRDRLEDRAQKRIAGALMELLPKRDQEVLAWVCQVSNKTPGRVALEMIKQSVVRERRAYREAKGGGGSSSQDLEALASRLPGRQ